MLISNRFAQMQSKTISGFQNLRCHCKILGCNFDTQKGRKKNTDQQARSCRKIYQLMVTLQMRRRVRNGMIKPNF